MEARRHDGIEYSASEKEYMRRTYMDAGSEKLSGYADGANRFHDICFPCSTLSSSLHLYLYLSFILSLSFPSPSISLSFFPLFLLKLARTHSHLSRSNFSTIFLFPTHRLAFLVIRMHSEITFSLSRHIQK